MKPRIPLLITALVMPLVVQAAGPIDGDIYGKINLSLDQVDFESATPAEDEWQLNSNASRFGVKGETGITDDISAIYQIEWEVDVDGESTTLGNRNRYLGLTGSFGTLLAGRHDTPLKLAQKNVDLFNDYVGGDIKNTFEGENRVSNLVMYTSPTFGNFSIILAFGPSEGDAATNDLGEAGDDGPADGISAMLDYTTDLFYFAVAIDQDVDQQDATRAVAQYSAGDLQLGLLLQQNKNQAGTLDESGFLVSGQYTLGEFVFKAQYGQVEDDESESEEDTASVGVDYKLASATKLFVYGNRNTDSVPIIAIPGVGIASLDIDDTVFGVGMEHKF